LGCETGVSGTWLAQPAAKSTSSAAVHLTTQSRPLSIRMTRTTTTRVRPPLGA
jgi:hypothetical protein